MIKALIFDVGGVLCMLDDIGFRNAIYKRYDVNEEQFTAVELENRRKLDAGEITAAQHLANIGKALGIQIDAEEYWKLRFDFVQINTELLELVRKLKPHYQVFILSNNSKPFADYLASIPGFMELFDRSLFSFQVKLKKPNPEFFQKLLEGTGVPPSACIFIDDRADLVTAAGGFGMHAILYTSNAALTDALHDISIEW